MLLSYIPPLQKTNMDLTDHQNREDCVEHVCIKFCDNPSNSLFINTVINLILRPSCLIRSPLDKRPHLYIHHPSRADSRPVPKSCTSLHSVTAPYKVDVGPEAN